jgi:hypothetical protein
MTIVTQRKVNVSLKNGKGNQRILVHQVKRKIVSQITVTPVISQKVQKVNRPKNFKMKFNASFLHLKKTNVKKLNVKKKNIVNRLKRRVIEINKSLSQEMKNFVLRKKTSVNQKNVTTKISVA